MSDVAVMRRTLEQVLAHPEAHGQGSWVCRTSACFAGWTVLLHRQLTLAAASALRWPDRAIGGGWTWTDPRDGEVHVSYMAIQAEAQFLLGLTDDEAEALFMGPAQELGDTAEAEAVAVAEAIIARDESRLTPEQSALLAGEGLPVDPQPGVPAVAGE